VLYYANSNAYLRGLDPSRWERREEKQNEKEEKQHL